MKKALIVILGFLLLLLVNALASIFFHPFHLQSALSSTGDTPRDFIWDGLVSMLIVYGLLLVGGALAKRFRASAPLLTVALSLAALTGYLLKFGFVTHNW